MQPLIARQIQFYHLRATSPNCDGYASLDRESVMEPDDIDDADQARPGFGVAVGLVLSLSSWVIVYGLWSGTIATAGCMKHIVYLASFVVALLATKMAKALNDRMNAYQFISKAPQN